MDARRVVAGQQLLHRAGFSRNPPSRVPATHVVSPSPAVITSQHMGIGAPAAVRHPGTPGTLGTLGTLGTTGALYGGGYAAVPAQEGFWDDPLAHAFTPGVAGHASPTLAQQDPAVVTLARGVRVRSKLVSWAGYSWPWILFVLAFVVGNGALMIFAGLNMSGIGFASPIMMTIWHFVQFVIFAALVIWTYVRFSHETLLEDKLRLPFLTTNAAIYNFAMFVAFLAWILNNTSAYAEVHFSSNSQAYVAFVAMNAATFVWFYVVVGLALMSWVVHYNYRKTLELTDLALSVDDEHLALLHNTTLQNMVASLRQQQQQPQHAHAHAHAHTHAHAHA